MATMRSCLGHNTDRLSGPDSFRLNKLAVSRYSLAVVLETLFTDHATRRAQAMTARDGQTCNEKIHLDTDIGGDVGDP